MSTDENLIIGFQDTSAATIDISESSSTVAIVNVGLSQPKTVEAPTAGCLTLHIAMIAYLNSPEFRNLAGGTRKNITLTIEKFFSFLSRFKTDQEVSLDFLQEFIQHYRNNSKAKDSVIYSQFNIVKKCLRWCFSEKNRLSDDTKLICRQYYSRAPNVQTSEKTPTPPLSRLFSDCPYNDTQLLDALKKLSIWIINHEGHLRSEARQLDRIRQLVEDIGSINIYESPASLGSFDAKNASRDKAKELYAVIITEIRNSKNLVLKERLVEDIRHPFEETVLSEEQLNWVLDHCLMKARDGKLAKCRESYQISKSGTKKSYKVGAFKKLTIRSLLVPTDIEFFAMQCLLACEKMNSSSIENLSLDDVVETTRGIQFQFQKKRRPTNNQVSITPLHTLSSTMGKTYRLFAEAMRSGLHHFNSSDRLNLLNYQVRTTKEAYIGLNRFGQASNSYIGRLLTEKSHLRSQLLQDFKESSTELEPIFWLLGRVSEQNKKVSIQCAEYDRVYQKNRSVKRSEFVTETLIGMTMEVIRQSAIISEDARLFNSPHLFNDANVTAQSANHSPAVHYDVYIDRSTAKEKIESDRLFAARIGELMEQDSKKIGELLEKTSVLDYGEALEVLGLPREDENARERIAKRIDELGIDIDLMDSFQANGKQIFFANKTSIALIIKYLEHIRANFDDLLNDDSPQLTKATLAARDYFYFSAILQKFPKEVREKGEIYANSLSFNYAKLSEIAGGLTNAKQ